MKKILFILAFFVSVGLFASNKAEISVKGVCCENLINPVGVDKNQPRFSWVLESQERNQIQTAYQIIVSSSRNNLRNNKGDSWDSKKVESDCSIFVPYSGSELMPATRYYWKVRVWGKNGMVSDWSEPGTWQMGLFNKENWQGAKWIGYRELPDSMRLVPGFKNADDVRVGNRAKERAVVPCFRKEFEVKNEVSEATLFISGLGQYKCFINRQKVGTDFLTPGWTNYDKTVFYNSFDVTKLLQKGANAVGVIVGNGFYYINKERYVKFVTAFGEPSLISLIKLKYADGSVEHIVTDQSWKCAPSAITYSSIYGGEDYDASLEPKGWIEPEFDDSTWDNALKIKGPSGILTAEKGYPVKVMEEIAVKEVKLLSDGSYLYDFGQNASGIVELKVKGKKGARVTLIPAELITDENFPDQSASGDPFCFTYTLQGKGVETWRPKFTYYGFRYVQVKGAVPDSCSRDEASSGIVALKMLHTRNSSPLAGSFECSNELFNKTNNLIRWAINSNMQSVLTDCPHREKHGWLEQTYLMGNSLAFNFDIYHLLKKIIQDMEDAQTNEGLIPDFVPEYRQSTGGFRDSPEWGSASIILPWLIYELYGDKQIIEDAWTTMTQYADYLKSKSQNYILSHGLGDWFDLGPAEPGVSQLTPIPLTATAIYYYDLVLLSKMAGIVNREKEAMYYASWAEDVKNSFNDKFFDRENFIYSTGSQTAMSMPYAVGLVDDEYKQKVLDVLEDSIRHNGKRLTAGDIGFHFLVNALTEGGKSQLLYDMNARDDVPGYGYQLKKGATALTESWQALESVSNNHFMLGHIMEWFYAGLGGIGQNENSSGYKEIEIKPKIVGDIIYAKAEHLSPYGSIVSEWYKSNEKLRMVVNIPVNTTAKVFIPSSPGQIVTESGKNIEKLKDIKYIGTYENGMIFHLGSGDYVFEVVNK